MSNWPRAQARLAVVESDWAGIGSGFGHLRARQVTVASSSPAWQGRTRSRRLWLPDATGAVVAVASRVVDDADVSAPLRSLGRGA